jgi:cytochrome c553
MIKHIIAAVATALALWSAYYMYSLDNDVNKLQRINELVASTKMEDSKLKGSVANQATTKVEVATKPAAKGESEMDKKLKALREKAGNIAAFEVSPLYKKSCASCHGNIGEGIIGPKLIGQSEDKVLNDLQEFKSGKRKNYVMYGLLNGLDEAQLKELSKEISTFKAKLEASQK